MHCTLWPKNYPPTKNIHRAILWLDKKFYKYIPHAIIGVSPECCHQVEILTNKQSRPLFQIRAQYKHGIFDDIPSPSFDGNKPFNILFAGRMVEYKGIFDILNIAETIEKKYSNLIHWHLCGIGPDYERLEALCKEKQLEDIITLHGWTKPGDLLKLYNKIHASIIPTTSRFAEGLAMVAAESILAGRPIITNPVVPASEILKDAAIIAETDNVDSYVGEIIKLVQNKELYQEKADACKQLGHQFLDRSKGKTAVLENILCLGKIK